MRLSSITADTKVEELINVEEAISIIEAGCKPAISKLKVQVSTITSEVAAGKGLSPSVYLAEGDSVLNSEALKVRGNCAKTFEILNELINEATKKINMRRKSELLDLKTKVSLRRKNYQADVDAADKKAMNTFDIYDKNKLYVLDMSLFDSQYNYKKTKIEECNKKLEIIDAELGKLGGV